MRLTARMILQVLLTSTLLAVGHSGGGPVGQFGSSAFGTDDSVEKLIASPSAQRVPLDEIRRAVAGGEYVARTAAEVARILGADLAPNIGVIQPPQIRRAEYTARLDGDRLVDGTVVLQIDDDAARGSVILGQSNLEQLKFTEDGAEVPLAALPDGRLSLLTSRDGVRKFKGTWQAAVRSDSNGMSFEIRFPTSSVCHFRILTPFDVMLSSPNAVVRSERVGEEVLWDLFPDSSRPVSIVCLTEEDRLTLVRDSVATVNSTFRVSEQTVLSTWAIAVPPDLADADISLNLVGGCRISGVTSDTGDSVSWEAVLDDEPSLVLKNLEGGRTITVEGESTHSANEYAQLPLLTSGTWKHADGRSSPLVVESSGVRVVIARHLAIDDLQLRGMYQQEVSFASNGDQIVELRQFAAAASAGLRLAKARSTAIQMMLIDDPVEAAGEVSVYVEIEPRSGRIYDVVWELAGRWKPILVTDMRSDESLYFTTSPDPEAETQELAVALRTFAAVNQSTQLRIQFRSTEAARADSTSSSVSVPILTNAQYRSPEYWVLSSGGSGYTERADATVVPNAEQEIESRFPWLIDVVTIDAARDLMQVPRLADLLDHTDVFPETAIRARTDYSIQLSDDQVIENLRMRFTSDAALPRSVIVVFPSGVDMQVADPESGCRLTRTSRQTGDGDREWLLTLPSLRQQSRDVTVGLRGARREGAAEYAAVPRLPEVRDTTVSARIVTGGESAGQTVALISENTDDHAAASTILEPGRPVLISELASRVLLRITREQVTDELPELRGTIYCSYNAADESGRCRCFADLVVSRSGSSNSLSIQWAEDSDVRFYVDDREVWCPTKDGLTNVLLPSDQPVCRLRMLWTSETTVGGWLHRSAQTMLPRFEAVDTSDVVSHVQIAADEYSFGQNTGWIDTDTDEGSDTRAVQTSDLTAGPVRSFLMRWQLAEQQGASVRFLKDSNGILRFHVTDQRMLWIGAAIAFCSVLILRKMVSSVRPRWQAFMMVVGVALASLGSVEAAWWASAANAGLAVVVVTQLFSRLVIRSLEQMRPADLHQEGSRVSTITAALLALVLTGQAPQPVDLPAVLIPEDARSADATVFVRKDILDAVTVDEVINGHVRVKDVNAEIRAGADGLTQMRIRATVASRPGQSSGRFLLPIESATLTECSVDGVQIAPVGDKQGRPSIVIPRTPSSQGDEESVDPPDDSDESRTNRMEDDNAAWQSNVIEYVIRSKMEITAERMNLHVPLPWSARCQIVISTTSDLAQSVRIAGSHALQATEEQPGKYLFAPLFNQGAVDLVIETNQVPVIENDSKAVAIVTCLAEIDLSKSRQRLLCDYQLTSLSQFPLESPLGMETRISEVPGFRLLECRGPAGQSLKTRLIDGMLHVSNGTVPLDEFEVTWEAQLGTGVAGLMIPAEILKPPRECSVEQILVGVRVVEPFEASPLLGENPALSAIALTPDEYTDSNLTPEDLIFEVAEDSGDILLPIVLNTALQRVNITQEVVAGVNELRVSCRCDIRPQGSRVFRQRLRVPSDLLIDQIKLSSAGTDRLRSFSCDNGILLVTLREGTLGNCRLTFSGVVPVSTDGRAEFTPITIDQANVQSSLLLSATESATGVLMDAGDAVSNESDGILELPYSLSTTPMRLTVNSEGRPVVLQVRRQNVPSAEVITLSHDGSPDDGCDVVIRISAGDQGWSGALPSMRDLTYKRADWIHDGMSTWLQPGASKLPPGRLEPGEAGLLLLNGLQPRKDETAFQVQIPVTEPPVAVKTVRVLHRKTTAPAPRQDYIDWMIRSFDDPDISLPDGLDDRSQAATWDEDTSSLRVAGMNETEQVAVPVGRRIRRSVSVTDLRVIGEGLSGTSDILLDFGEALEAQIHLPESVMVTGCRLDGQELSLQGQGSLIQINREDDVQRLVINWAFASRRAGYLPQQYRLAIPTVDALKSEHFLLMQPPETESWSPNASMSVMTSAQFETRIQSSVQQFGTLTGPSPSSAEAAASNIGSVIEPTAADFLQTYQPTLRRTVMACAMEAPETAGVACRRRIPWPQWIPITALLSLGVVTTSRRLRAGRAPHDSTSVAEHPSGVTASKSATEADLRDSADAELPSDRGDSDG